MRQSLMNTFSKIYILDLHGNSKKKETCPDGAKDENVFDIQQGVSIALFVKEPDSDKPAEIHHCDLWGVRKNKYEWLLENDIKSTQWQTITPNSPYYFFIPKEESKRKEYEEYIKINEIMPTNVTGIVTARDGLVIDFSEKELLQKIRKFRDTQKSDSEIRELFFPSKSSKKYLPGDTRGWKVADARKKLQKDTAWREKAEYILYRPFDIRSIYYTNDMVDWSREKLMGHMLAGENVGLIVSRQIITEFKHVFVSRNIINFNSIATAGRFGSGPLFPLYLYPDNEKKDLFEQREWDAGRDGRVPNLDNDFVDKLAGGLKLEFVTDGKGDLKKTFGPEDIFYYIYAIFHSPSYRKRYAEFLKYDFPRVPLTKSKVLFRKLSQTGEHLAKLHLLEAEELEDTNNQPVYPKEGSNVIEKGYPKFVADSDKPDKGRVYINKAQYFEGVRPDVWEFYVGGYQVCHKWLKDRKNRELSFDDISHYKNITAALAETIKLMDEIDEIIESRSGWPLE
jgi:predicted helicase